ncbi:hypothetical protein [Candidatus Ferrigenium straubiae]|jgi:hypothetical protein|uniref:hypothetical protein n=1 Tax=Candidatus Ferrigenium straubiae TaxID=2919506 RepID=UPI003F4A96FC
MFEQWKRIAVTLSTAVLVSLGSGVAFAEGHQHSHGAGETAQLTLDNGKKLTTDNSLRQGMGRIRDALAADLPAIHSGKATSEQYRALARKMDDQIAFMVKNCKLEPKVDAMLHLVLADIIAGADAMKTQGGSDAYKGAAKIARALDNYGKYFDHPGWHGLEHIH